MSDSQNTAPGFLGKHWPKLIIIALFAGLIFYHNFKVSALERTHVKATEALQVSFATKVDSLTLAQTIFTSRVFAWSVRSEWLRDNHDNLGQLANRFVREADVSLVQLVAASSDSVFVSTDKRFEGDRIVYPEGVNVGETFVHEENGTRVIYTPIMGFTERLGTLRVVLK
jgi:hypothetical protein